MKPRRVPGGTPHSDTSTRARRRHLRRVFAPVIRQLTKRQRAKRARLEREEAGGTTR